MNIDALCCSSTNCVAGAVTETTDPLYFSALDKLRNVCSYKMLQVWLREFSILADLRGGELKGRDKDDLAAGHRRMLCTHTCI